MSESHELYKKYLANKKKTEKAKKRESKYIDDYEKEESISRKVELNKQNLENLNIMSKQEIENYNRLCTEFLGYKLRFIDEEKTQSYLIHNDKYKVTGGTILLYKGAELKFHSDWNWIMEVVLSINMIPNSKNPSDTTLYTYRLNVQSILRSAKKEAVVQAINQFLIWYDNTNK